MSKSELFPRPMEQPRTPKQYVFDELRADLGAFRPHERALIARRIAGEPLEPHEQAATDDARDQWWERKYGFPYALKPAREEVLRRKYAQPEELQRSHALLTEIFDAIEHDDERTIARLKDRYLSEFPDQLEGVEVLFGVREFLEQSVELGKRRGRPNYLAEAKPFQDITEYQFLFTHYLLSAGEDKTFLQRFWNVADQIADRIGQRAELDKLRRGLLSQVAAFRVLQELGREPHLSHPSEDAFRAVDLWAGDDTAIQVKGEARRLDQPAVVEVNDVAFPVVKTRSADDRAHFNANLHKTHARFRMRLREYGQLTGKAYRGYVLVIPNQKIDFVTGEPAPELVAKFRELLRRSAGASSGRTTRAA
ncbi:MAG: hypothetical protein Q8R16_01585 [bacterium]|nr:hypothetical protein [bacterium]